MHLRGAVLNAMNSNKNYLNLPLSELIEDTAAKSPTPGGGSIAAVVGALAAALGRMAVNYTVGKPKYAAHEVRLQAVLAELRRSGQMFMQLAAEDMAAYERYSASRKSGDAAEQEAALATATAVPLEIVAVAAVVLGLLDEIKSFLNAYLLSDAQAAAILTDAAAQAAALNVRANLKLMSRGQEQTRVAGELERMLVHCRERRAAVVEFVPGEVRGTT